MQDPISLMRSINNAAYYLNDFFRFDNSRVSFDFSIEDFSSSAWRYDEESKVLTIYNRDQTIMENFETKSKAISSGLTVFLALHKDETEFFVFLTDNKRL